MARCPCGATVIRVIFNDFYMCWGLSSHDFHIVWDDYQPNCWGLCTDLKDSLLKVG